MVGRTYTVDGKRLPSVTTIISSALPNPGIVAWKQRVGLEEANRISAEATTHGTAMHALVEQVGRGNRHLLTPEETALVAPYTQWADDNVSVFLGVEQFVASQVYGFAGTADGIVVLNGDRYPAILDAKSSKTARGEAEWRVQLAAYAIGAEEHLGLVCRRRLIVRLPKDKPGKLFVHELPEDELEHDKRIFLALLEVYQWMGKHEPVSNSIGRIAMTR